MASFKILGLLLLPHIVLVAEAGSPYKYFDWTITYGTISPLGLPQQGILINGEFPGPIITCDTNDNIIVNVHNLLPEPFLLSWNGIQQRKDSFQDGVSGTTCPIPPGKNYTYQMQVKDQIGSFFYFPSLALHKAAGGYGGISILSRPQIPVPFPPPAGDYTLLVGDWYKTSHVKLKKILDSGEMIMPPDGVIINGRGQDYPASFTVEYGKTYRLRISNVGLESSLNFRIQGHRMKLVEVEGTHTIQNEISSLDIHIAQSYSVLITADQPAGDYHIVVSTRFTGKPLTTAAILHYQSSRKPPSGALPLPPPGEPITWSMNQARSIRTNLSASGPRPNPQGSYHYGLIKVTRRVRLANSPAIAPPKKQRFGINGVSFTPSNTPLKLADYYNITGVFRVGSIPDQPPRNNNSPLHLATSVMGADLREFMEIVFENRESSIQSWHLDGYSFFVVGMDRGSWEPQSRKNYNLRDAVSRCTTQVYPSSWTAVYVSLDNVGMWNLRSEVWARQYLGEQFYLRVWTPVKSPRNEYNIPRNALLCGKAAHLH